MPVFLMRKRKGVNLGGGAGLSDREDLPGVGGGESVIRKHFIKNNLFSKKENNKNLLLSVATD